MKSKKQRNGAVRLPLGRVPFFHSRLLAWYRKAARDFPWRRRRGSIYLKILAEILLQRTRAETVGQFLPQFVNCFPSWDALARSSEVTLARLLRPLGLWQRRSKTIRALAVELAIRKGRFPRERTDIEALPGVGQYIANAVLLFCHGQPEPLLDVNMARVLERYFGPRSLADIRYDPYLQGLARAVLRGSRDAVSLNWAILDLAALVCTGTKPRCPQCPLATRCLYAREHQGSSSPLMPASRRGSLKQAAVSP
jgi:A/G-specific adenine glycosylase